MGTIVTFYSYKGGTGRTLALANVAALLAQWGHRVLCVDWDLEAPGLHLYFDRHAPPPKGGLVEIVGALGKERRAKRPTKGRASWRSFVLETDIGAPRPGAKRRGAGARVGRLDLLAAGRPGRGYVARLQALDWEKLYQEGSGEAIEALRAEWSSAYDFVLLDSRTGITDIGGICTAQLPDILVLMATPNEQSLDGIIDVAERARAARARMPLDKPALQLLPVPSRFDQRTENAISARWVQRFATRLEPYYRPWLHSAISPQEILSYVKLPYVPVWSFGERLPVLEEGTSDPETLGFALETLAALLAHRLAHTDVLVRNRDSFLAAARGARAEADSARGDFGTDVFVSHAPADASLAERLSRALKTRGLRAIVREKIDGTAYAREQALRGAKNLVTVVGPEFGGWQLEETMTFLKLASAPSQRVVVLLSRDARADDVPPLLRGDSPILTSAQPFDALVERLAGLFATRVRPDDPHHGLWGRLAERKGRVLGARVRPMKDDPDWFRIDLSVEAHGRALRGPVRFHLPASFKRPMREVMPEAGAARLSILASGAFTVGAEADEGATVLELDLATVPRAPRGFVEG